MQVEVVMSYQHYRNTTLGIALSDALDEQLTKQQISPELAAKVLKQFDRSISTTLSSKAKTKYTFKGTLRVYRYCDNVWTCVIDNAEFKESHGSEIIQSNKVKIVACDGTSTKKD